MTHDAGATWTTPVLVSGDALFAFVSTPIATADGRIFVAYEDFTHFDNGRDDYAVAELDPDTGARIAGPFKVDTLIDGSTDYPIALGRQTYQDSIFRSWSAGNIAADPTDGDHLAVEWSDMRNSPLPAPDEPVRGGDELRHGRQPVVRRGAHLVRRPSRSSCPATSSRAGARTTPTACCGSASSTASTTRPTTSTATRSRPRRRPGSLSFSTDELTTVRSDPTKNNRWFAATLDPDFPFATSFIGDYSGIAATPSGGVVAVWTDLRNQVSFAGANRRGRGRVLRHLAVVRRR